MKKNIRNILKYTAMSTCFLSSGLALADSPSPDTAVISQLKALNNNVQVVGNRIQAIAEAKTKANANIDTDNNIQQSMTINPAYLSGQNANDAYANQLTENDIQNQLMPISDKLLSTQSGMIDADSISKRLMAYMSQQANLTLNLPGSDTVYSNDPTVIAQASLYADQLPDRGIGPLKSSELRDYYFNFSSLIQPMVYQENTDQATAANTFVSFLMSSYKNPSDDLNTNAFQQELNNSKDANDRVSLYAQLLNNDNYRKFQLMTRSLIASRSVAVNDFQQLIAERTAIKGLGKQAGMKDTHGNTVNDASPLQVESYIANRRINDPHWYAHVQTESTANVQRETLIVLSEIESQMFQAHLDHERLLATVASQSALSNSMATQAVSQKVSQVNQDIAKFTLPSQTSANASNGNSN